MSEPILVGSYKALFRDLFRDIGPAARMIRKGKMKLIPSVVRGCREVRRIFRESTGGGHAAG